MTRVTSPKSSKSSKSPKFSWHKRHRQALMVFHHMELSDDQIVRNFNQFFRQELDLVGSPNGLSKTTLQAQYAKSNRTKSLAWQEVEACQPAELSWVSQKLRSMEFNHDAPTTSTPTRPSRSLHSNPTRPTTSRPSQASSSNVSVVIETSKTVNKYQGHRGVFKKFPEDMAVAADRTRIVSGQQIPIIRATDSDLAIEDPISAHEAHSSIPELLFRFYDDYSQGAKNADGFIAAYYTSLTTHPPPPPDCADLRLYATVLNHLNKIRFSSELISTSSNLFFVMRMAAKSNANARISVVRSGVMPSTKIFHARPYHLRYKRDKVYYNNTYMNPAAHEYLVWATIPDTAIICDFSFSELERQIVNNPCIARALRLDQMRSKSSNGKLQDRFLQEKTTLDIELTIALAKFLPYFGVDARSPSSTIARLISELIRGWRINLEKATAVRWEMLAGSFAYTLADGQRTLSDEQLIRAREAFLVGLRIGSAEINWHLDAGKQSRMLKKGLRLGLGAHTTTVDESPQMHTDRNAMRCIEHFIDLTVEEGMETEVEEGPVAGEAETELWNENKTSRHTYHHKKETRKTTFRQHLKIDDGFVVVDRSDDEDYVMEDDASSGSEGEED